MDSIARLRLAKNPWPVMTTLVRTLWLLGKRITRQTGRFMLSLLLEKTWVRAALFLSLTSPVALCAYLVAYNRLRIKVATFLPTRAGIFATQLIYRRPAVLDDMQETFRGAMTSFLPSADPNLFDNGRKRKRFCCNPRCNPDLAHYTTLQPPDDPDCRECTVLVPEACPHCNTDPSLFGFRRVVFYATAEQYHALSCMRSIKHVSDKKSIHTAVSIMCEGRSHTTFDMQRETLLEHFGLINHLQCCRLMYHVQNPFHSLLYDFCVNRALQIIAWSPSSIKQQVARWAIRDLEPVDRVTGTDYATEWRRVVLTGVTINKTTEYNHKYSSGAGPDNELKKGDIGNGLPPGLEERLNGLGVGTPAPAPEPTTPSSQPSDIAAGHAQVILRAQEIDADEHDGKLQIRQVANLTDEDIVTLTKLKASGNLPPPRVLHELWERARLIMPGWRPGLLAVYRDHVFQAGPLLSNTVIWDHKDVITKAASATNRVLAGGRWALDDVLDPSAHPDNPRRLRARNKVRSNLRKFWTACTTKVFSQGKIASFVSAMPLVEEIRSPKLSSERFFDIYDEMRAHLGLPPITANIKEEVVAKHKKSGRIVFDTGLESSVTMTITAYVFDHMLFDHVGGASIKHKPRDQAINEIVKACSTNINGILKVIVELDQTGFDGHNRIYDVPDGKGGVKRVGIMYELCCLLEHVASCIAKSANDCWRKVSVMLDNDVNGKRHYIKFKSDDIIARWKGVIEELSQLSGKNTTSSGNWISEASIDLCVNVGNPEIIWDQKLDDNFSWKFTQFEDTRKSVYYRCWLEGDDQLGHGDEHIADHAPLAALLYEDLGFEAKRVILNTPGVYQRAEFVGVHILVRDGLTVPGMWMPDVSRALICSGAYIAETTATTDVNVANCALSLLSRAVMFAGKCDAAASYLRALSDHWASLSSDAALDAARLSTYKAHAWGHADSSYRALCTAYDDSLANALPFCQQTKLLSCSLQAEVEPEETAFFSANAPGILPHTNSSAVFSFLPNAFRAKCLSTVA